MLAARLFLAAWDYSLRLTRLGIRSQARGVRICLPSALPLYPGLAPPPGPLAARHSPHHPRPVLVKSPATAVEAAVTEATVADTAIHLSHIGPGSHATVTPSFFFFNNAATPAIHPFPPHPALPL